MHATCGIACAENHHDVAVVDSGARLLGKLRISDDAQQERRRGPVGARRRGPGDSSGGRGMAPDRGVLACVVGEARPLLVLVGLHLSQ